MSMVYFENNVIRFNHRNADIQRGRLFYFG